MKALDTNVLVRFLVRDDEKQARAVHRMFSRAEQGGETFYIPALVLLETIWVLESAYDIGRGLFLDFIEDGDPVGALIQPGDRKQHHLLEFSEEFPSGHAFFHKCED